MWRVMTVYVLKGDGIVKKKSIVIREFNDNQEREDMESYDQLCPEGTWHFKENCIIIIEFTDNNFREDVENMIAYTLKEK